MANVWQSWGALSRSGKVASVLLGLNLAAIAAEGACGAGVAVLVRPSGTLDWEGVQMMAAAVSATMVLSLVTYVAAAIAFLVWFRARFKALGAMGITGLSHTPAQAVYLYFIPFVGVYAPWRVAQEMWRASDPASAVYDAKKRSDGGRLIGAWWWSFMAYGLVSFVSSYVSSWALEEAPPKTADGLAELVTRLQWAGWVTLAASVVGLLAGGLALRVILALEDRQRAKGRALSQAA